jgi:hypothetical protein
MTDDITTLRAAIAAGPSDGPWDYHTKLSGSENHRGYRVGKDAGWLVADVMPIDSDGKEGGANAAYIAAASPDRIARLLDELDAERARAEMYAALVAGVSAAMGDAPGTDRSDLPQRVERLRADAERLDFLAAKTCGANDSERYLPFRLYWGPGQRKPIRDVIDAARGAA